MDIWGKYDNTIECTVQQPSLAAMPARSVQMNKQQKQLTHQKQQTAMRNINKTVCANNRAMEIRPHSTGEDVTTMNDGHDNHQQQQQLYINNGLSLNARKTKLSSITTKASFSPQSHEHSHPTQTIKG